MQSKHTVKDVYVTSIYLDNYMDGYLRTQIRHFVIQITTCIVIKRTHNLKLQFRSIWSYRESCVLLK